MDTRDHNAAYHPVLLEALPPGCARALDVGCGDGLLARRLRERVPHVTGIDVHAPGIARARAQDPLGRIEFLVGDFLAHPFEDGSFDAVTAVASLHHLDAVAALTRMRDLLSPGGTLAVLGLARSRLPHDLPWELAAVVTYQLGRLRPPPPAAPPVVPPVVPPVAGTEDAMPMVWPPPHDHVEIRALAERVLPGVRYRRHVLWRYSLIWTKPSSGPATGV